MTNVGGASEDRIYTLIHMLRQTWKQEAKQATIDHYHWINDTGLLSVGQVQAIARTVWG